MNNREVREAIVRVMSNSKFRWRTPSGIAKDVGTSIQQVRQVLERSSEFVRAKKSNARGEALFSTKVRYQAETPVAQRVLNAIANKIIG